MHTVYQPRTQGRTKLPKGNTFYKCYRFELNIFKQEKTNYKSSLNHAQTNFKFGPTMMILKLSFTSTSPSLVIASFFHFWKWNYSYELPSSGKDSVGWCNYKLSHFEKNARKPTTSFCQVVSYTIKGKLFNITNTKC